MNASLYAPRREQTVTDMEQALSLANSDFAYETREFPVSRLTMSGEEGKIIIADTAYPITVDGMRGVSSRFKIPNPFAQRIPYDLLKTNIERLAREEALRDGSLVAHIRNDGSIVNVSRGLTIPTNNAEVINRTMRLFPGSAMTSRINLSDRGVDIDLINSSSQTIEARVGDPIQVGLRISISESAFWTSYARVLLYVLRCTNGAVMAKSLGHEKLRIKHENKPETVYSLFFRKVAALTPNFQMLSSLLQASGEAYATDEMIAQVWRALTNLGVEDSVADMLIGMVDDDRESIISVVKNRRKANERVISGETEKAKPTAIKVYDIFDRTTTYALTRDQEERQDIQQLAGNMILHMKDHLN